MGYQAKKTVLILEDQYSSRKALVHMVEECGRQTVIYDFEDSSSAFRCAMENKIDLFLVDIILKPEIPNDCSGIQFAEAIRKHERYATSEIVFITSLAGLQAELLRSVHCFDYLEKPVTEERVQKVVTEALCKMDGPPKEDEMVFLRKERVTYPISTNQIVYVESRRKTLLVYMQDEMINVPNMSLKKFIQGIRTQQFLFPAKGVAVNLQHIEYVDPTNRFVKMRGDEKVISIGERMKDQFFEELYMCGDDEPR